MCSAQCIKIGYSSVQCIKIGYSSVQCIKIGYSSFHCIKIRYRSAQCIKIWNRVFSALCDIFWTFFSNFWAPAPARDTYSAAG